MLMVIYINIYINFYWYWTISSRLRSIDTYEYNNAPSAVFWTGFIRQISKQKLIMAKKLHHPRTSRFSQRQNESPILYLERINYLNIIETEEIYLIKNMVKLISNLFNLSCCYRILPLLILSSRKNTSKAP